MFIQQIVELGVWCIFKKNLLLPYFYSKDNQYC